MLTLTHTPAGAPLIIGLNLYHEYLAVAESAKCLGARGISAFVKYSGLPESPQSQSG